MDKSKGDSEQEIQQYMLDRFTHVNPYLLVLIAIGVGITFNLAPISEELKEIVTWVCVVMMIVITLLAIRKEDTHG